MKLDDRCPFCGSRDCERIQSTGNIWSETGALYFNCKKEEFKCTLHPSIWYGEEKCVAKICSKKCIVLISLSP